MQRIGFQPARKRQVENLSRQSGRRERGRSLLRRFCRVFNDADRRWAVELVSHAAPAMVRAKNAAAGRRMYDLGQGYHHDGANPAPYAESVIVSPRFRTMRRAHHSRGRTIKTIDAQ